ncbi:phospholipid carrier-dependent glycosyltransferase [Thermoleptolyngbya sp. M55_K2018_002]|uniref:phospholipid carrier-dependent glycosyltransferase n=1 Tax=Thermoleptolyngbya sp. M55_K2018_002 TaxID=2747808 RepID=UPI0019E2BBF6|nr:phospholipid carrier-dependent glycosyltransferase [Thermoleptolyngbya sp. M55_K2018_002]HIK41944.1 phospholipid carrier-dependent glycosyltransferase [Thermoleptolyngbya sp. M55_K2018_002]
MSRSVRLSKRFQSKRFQSKRFQPAASSSSLPWYGLGLVGIFGVSLALRLWGLGRFNTLVFDEVYYAKFAAAFLQGQQEFGGHPPLSTYLIAGGIWLSEQLGWGGPETYNGLSGLYVSTISYRWLNAVTGAVIPLVLGAIAHLLTGRKAIALLTALLAACEGFLLVESRYALNNVYLILFGLLGWWCLLRSLHRLHSANKLTPVVWLNLVLAGMGFGASVGIKWNGVAFLAGAYLLWIVAWGMQRLQQRGLPSLPFASPLSSLSRLNVGVWALSMAGIPFLTYYLSWLPYIQLDPSTSFAGWQNRILDYHSRVGGMDAHPYCSPWYTWPLMLRPVAYFYKTAAPGDPVPVVGPDVPTAAGDVIYDVHAMGTPTLWWLSTLAVALLAGAVGYWLWHWGRSLWAARSGQTEPLLLPPATQGYLSAAAFVVGNWAVQWLMWMRVTRCTFLYHYMSAELFAVLGLALVLDRWLRNAQSGSRWLAWGAIALVLLGFIFWMPLFLGLPLSADGLQLRRWLPSWI